MGYDARRGDLYLQLRNDGRRDCVFTVQSNKAYARQKVLGGGRWVHGDRDRDEGPGKGRGHGHGHGHGGGRPDGDWTVRVEGGGETLLSWSLEASGQWYDLAVTCDSDKAFYRRLAGRVETGRHAVSDPAMGMADRF